MYQFNLGEIFWLEIAYEDEPNESKIRPVIIVGNKDNNLLILVSTTTKSPDYPPKYYDKFKIPILNWHKAGFIEPSWALGFRLIELSVEELKSLVTPEDYIGIMHKSDFNFLTYQLELIHKK